MRVKELITFLAIVALVATGCNDEPQPVNPTPENPTPEEGVEFTANFFDGEYYGDYYSPGIGNYYLHLSDNGFEESGYAQPNSRYYRIDLYSDYYAGAEVESLQLPVGTYTLDMENTLAHGTFSVAWSKYMTTDGEGNFIEEASFEAGELIVSEDGAVLKVTINGEEHTVTYEGKTLVSDKRSATGEDVGGGDDDFPEGTLSTLTEDREVVLDDHEMVYLYYGDYYETGLHNWTFALWPLDRIGDHIQFDIMTDSADDFLGTYSVGDASTPYSFFSGYIDGEDGVGYLLGSWYYTDDGITMAPFMSGTLIIEEDNTGKISLRFEVKDDRDNTLYGRWVGYAQEIEQ